jgi:hypothetical protein
MADDSLFPVPDHIKGRMTNRSQAAKDRADWIRRAAAAGMPRLAMAEALNIPHGRVGRICLKILGPKGRRTDAANEARLKKFRDERHGVKNGVTYAELHAAGLTEREAAARRGESLTPARRWARETGKTWADARSRDEVRAKHRRRLREIEPNRAAGYMASLRDPERHRLALMTPDQRADYDIMVRANIPADEAAVLVGCPEAAPSTWKAAQAAKTAAQKAARAEAQARARQRRKFLRLAQRDPEAAMLALMKQQPMEARHD